MSILEELSNLIEVGGPRYTDVPPAEFQDESNPSETASIDNVNVFEVNPQHASGPERLFITTPASKKEVEKRLSNMKESWGNEAISSALVGMGPWYTVGTWGGQINMGDFGLRRFASADLN